MAAPGRGGSTRLKLRRSLTVPAVVVEAEAG